MIVDGLGSFEIPFLDANMFRQVIMSCTSDTVINFVILFYGVEWQPHFTRSLIV